MKELPDKPSCPRCGSFNLGLLPVQEEDTYSLIDKKGEKLTKRERKLKRRAMETAKLISNYGKSAAIALSGRGLKINDAKEILKEEPRVSDRLYKRVIEAERKALKRRFL